MSEHFVIVDGQEIPVVKRFDNKPVVLMSSFSEKSCYHSSKVQQKDQTI